MDVGNGITELIADSQSFNLYMTSKCQLGRHIPRSLQINILAIRHPEDRTIFLRSTEYMPLAATSQTHVRLTVEDNRIRSGFSTAN